MCIFTFFLLCKGDMGNLYNPDFSNLDNYHAYVPRPALQRADLCQIARTVE